MFLLYLLYLQTFKKIKDNSYIINDVIKFQVSVVKN